MTVVESSGDSGPQGTMITAADDPAVIAAGGVDNLHIVALNDGYHSYVSNNMAAQSSGGYRADRQGRGPGRLRLVRRRNRLRPAHQRLPG